MKRTLSVTIVTVLISLQLTAQNWLIAGNSNITTSNFLGTTNNKPLIIKTNNAERMRVLGTGNVGIGIATPENKLHIFKGSAGNVTGFSAAPLIVENSANCYIQMLSPNASATGILFGKPQNNLSGGIFYNDVSFNPNGMDFRTNGNITQMVLNKTGNLGVGTLSPTAKLHVFKGSAGVTGDANAPLIVENSTNNYINILAPDNAETGILFGKPASNASGGIIYNSNQNLNGFQFRTNNNHIQMVLSDSGNLGIGTLVPGHYKVKISHGQRVETAGDYGVDIENVNTDNGIAPNWEIYTAPVFGGNSFGELWLLWDGSLKGEFNSADGQYFTVSDERLKTNIKPMPAMLDKINQLKPSVFQFKNTRDTQQHTGFIAQEVLNIFPDLVKHNVNAERKLDLYTIDYSGFGVIAIKGIQELAPVIEEQKKEIDTLKDQILQLQTIVRILSDKITNMPMATSNASLQQNQPNPFNKNTIIRYTVPQGSKGQINIYDQTGKIIKTFTANESGQSDLNGSGLTSGTYTYTLLVNGKVMGSKQMVVIK